ncbi:MAG: exo-alpha-sialidase [Phycisphaerae bacterium]|nr:exo-alpha-sialidase [Phycisphaerae bacterium]
MKRRAFVQSIIAGAGCPIASAVGDANSRRIHAPKPQAHPPDRLVHVYKGSPPDHCVCDQALRILPDKTWAIFFMTGGDHEPRKENYIAMCRSNDRGNTWSKKQPVLRYKDRACLLSEVIVHNGEIRVMTVTHGGYFEDWRNVVLTSKDSGKTWADPVPFEPLPRRTFIRNLYVSTWGEWILPYQTYDTVADPAVSPLKDGSFKAARNGVLISSDEGKTWTKSADVGPIDGWAENNVVELSDGSLAMLIRADGKGYLLRSDSKDRGRTWSPPKPAGICNPGSKFRLHRLTTGRIVLIQNANPKPGLRNPLALWASDDDMKTWFCKRVLVDFPGQLQYPDGFVDEKEGYAHFAFDYNRHDLIYVAAALPPT